LTTSDPSSAFFAGDLWDIPRVARRRGEAEKRANRVKLDFDSGMEFFEWYRPEAITLGNHDIRLWDTKARRADGRPTRNRLIGTQFEKLRAQAQVPRCFHTTKERAFIRSGS
jgi:hypothetical protein